jgi:hypothetical protein
MFSILTEAQVSDSVAVSDKNKRKPVLISDLQDLTKDGFNFWQDRFKGHLAGFDFGFNFYLNPDYSNYIHPENKFMSIDPFRSNSFSIQLIQQSIGLQYNRNTMGLVAGIGLQFRNFWFRNNITLTKEAGGKIYAQELEYEKVIKSRLSDTRILVPLLFEFQIPVKNYADRFYFATGLYGGVRIGSHTKVKFESEGKKEIIRVPDDYSLEPLSAGVMVRTGYRRLRFYAMYDVTQVFRNNLGPGLNTLSVGLTVVKF